MQAAIPANIAPTPPNSSSPNRGKDGTPLWKQILEWGAFLIALGLLIVNICQMRATQDAVDKSREANDLSREALYSVQRAFITNAKPTTDVVEYDVVNGLRRKKPLKLIEFTYHWENVGNTPAIGIVTAVGKVEQPDEITEQEFITTAVDRTTAKSALGPKAILDSGTLRDDDSFLSDNTGVPRFTWGWIVYRDMFPKTKPHVTEWCWKITEVKWKLDERGKRGDLPRITASACTHHNCVDESCEDYAYITSFSPADH